MAQSDTYGALLLTLLSLPLSHPPSPLQSIPHAAILPRNVRSVLCSDTSE